MLTISPPARGWICVGKSCKNPPKARIFHGMGRYRVKGWVLAGLVMAAGALSVLGGCATAPASPEALAVNDPYEQFNRAALKRNAFIDHYLVIPTVGLYFLVVPEGGRRGVHNFLGNLALPTVFVNDMLQGEVSRAGKSAWRLVLNSTIGVAGFFDPASKMGIPGHGEDFGQTLAVWGVNEGPYLVLPFLGPSNPRDALGLATDILLIDPTNQIPFKQHIWWDAGRMYFTLLDLKGQSYQTLQGIQRSSVDYYSSLRSLYRQMRAEQIRNGRQSSQELPDF
jgi:phospholipid-binding lipoprotein MlaA